MNLPAPMRLRELLKPWLESVVSGDLEIGDLRLDHREIQPGQRTLFIALNGATMHGLEFAAAAIERGAIAVLFDPAGAAGLSLPEGVPVVPLKELRGLLSAIAMRFFGEPAKALTVIGVTGTNGKTSTVQLLAQALTQLGHRCATLGTLGGGLWPELVAGERTTPDAIAVARFFAQMRDAGASHVAMEVSSHALDQGRVNAVPFKLAVFTNLTRDHLDYHGSMAAYAAAKARLFRWPGLKSRVLNLDDKFGQELAADRFPSAHTTTYALEPVLVKAVDQRHLSAGTIHSRHDGLEFELQAQADGGPVQNLAARSSLVGRFNIANLLAVIGALCELGIPLEQTLALLPGLEPVNGRMHKASRAAEAEPLVVIDYAHTPDALEKALHSLRAHTTGKLICVFGCGGERDRGKRPQMGAIADRLADVVIVTDDNPRSEDGDRIVGEILAGIGAERARVVRDRTEAITQAITGADQADAVLIAGKGHEPYQEIGGRKLPFSDLQKAREVLDRRLA